MPAIQTRPPSTSSTPVPPPRQRRVIATWAVPLGYLVVSLFGMWWIDARPDAVLAGFEDIAALLQRMVPPVVDDPGSLLELTLETLWIAIAGTGLATIVSLPLAAAASNRYSGPRAVQWVARAIIVLSRAVPTLLFAIIFVRIFGLGPLAGALAVAAHSIGMIGKLMTDVFEEQDPVANDAVAAVGASRTQIFLATTLSRALPAVSSLVLYRLDINIRASAVLGLVGAGGIGVALQTAIGSLNYQRALGIIVFIVVLLLILELIAYLVQRAVAEHAEENSAVALYGKREDPRVLGWNVSRGFRVGGAVAAAGAFMFSLTQLQIDFARMGRSVDIALSMLAGFFPPNISAEVLIGVLESFLMAITATTVGGVFGLVLAILSTRHLIRFEPLSLAIRGALVLVRGVPDIIFALLFVAALGLGPFAGFLALTISCTVLSAKLFADSLEKVDPAPIRALQATGAGRIQVFVSGVWPQFVPSFISNGMLTSDLALRESAVLGIVGAGGVGFILEESVATLDYQTTAGVLVSFVAIVVLLEAIARWARRRIL
ncbi:phosphonate ABC transporter, permease protein PhnE [Microbacter sp. GSS18]|nr:phosphonate ABC transporter, permease protein PhnE [Microbacter sp. GSS18]